MLYSVQNAFGEVYGTFRMPPSGKSAEVLAAELGAELSDILGINGVRDCPLTLDSRTQEKEDRVVIDIEPVFGQEDVRIARIHETVGRLTLSNEQ